SSRSYSNNENATDKTTANNASVSTSNYTSPKSNQSDDDNTRSTSGGDDDDYNYSFTLTSYDDGEKDRKNNTSLANDNLNSPGVAKKSTSPETEIDDEIALIKKEIEDAFQRFDKIVELPTKEEKSQAIKENINLIIKKLKERT